jgi:hypothetical protein
MQACFDRTTHFLPSLASLGRESEKSQWRKAPLLFPSLFKNLLRDFGPSRQQGRARADFGSSTNFRKRKPAPAPFAAPPKFLQAGTRTLAVATPTLAGRQVVDSHQPHLKERKWQP